jgi:hypothetical protein
MESQTLGTGGVGPELISFDGSRHSHILNLIGAKFGCANGIESINAAPEHAPERNQKCSGYSSLLLI